MAAPLDDYVLSNLTASNMKPFCEFQKLNRLVENYNNVELFAQSTLRADYKFVISVPLDVAFSFLDYIYEINRETGGANTYQCALAVCLDAQLPSRVNAELQTYSAHLINSCVIMPGETEITTDIVTGQTMRETNLVRANNSYRKLLGPIYFQMIEEQMNLPFKFDIHTLWVSAILTYKMWRPQELEKWKNWINLGFYLGLVTFEEATITITQIIVNLLSRIPSRLMQTIENYLQLYTHESRREQYKLWVKHYNWYGGENITFYPLIAPVTRSQLCMLMVEFNSIN